MNKQKVITIGLVLTIIGMLAAVVLGSKNKNTDLSNQQSTQSDSGSIAIDQNSPIFFYGNTCPHCADVEKWMKENQIEEKVTLIKKEVYDNRQNSQELTEVAQSCGLPTDSIGVPFLYTEGKCLIGTPDIIDYLTKRANSPATSSGEGDL
mgnify:CR=1 FL=1